MTLLLPLTRRAGTRRPRPHSAGRESRLGSYPRCARRRGEWRVEMPTGPPTPHRLWCPGLQTRATVGAAADALRRHWPSAAHSVGRESRLRSYPRCARCRGEGCAWATDVRRTDAPVVVRTTRITETGLAARNRLADFPGSAALDFSRGSAARAPLRGPRPASTGTSHAAARSDLLPLICDSRILKYPRP